MGRFHGISLVKGGILHPRSMDLHCMPAAVLSQAAWSSSSHLLLLIIFTLLFLVLKIVGLVLLREEVRVVGAGVMGAASIAFDGLISINTPHLLILTVLVLKLLLSYGPDARPDVHLVFYHFAHRSSTMLPTLGILGVLSARILLSALIIGHGHAQATDTSPVGSRGLGGVSSSILGHILLKPTRLLHMLHGIMNDSLHGDWVDHKPKF